MGDQPLGPGPLPIRGEADNEDVGLGTGAGRGNPNELGGMTEGQWDDISATGGVNTGVGPDSDIDPGIAGPGQTPDVEGGAFTGDTIGTIGQDAEIASATDAGSQVAFAQPTRDESTAGTAGIPERGTVAGITTVGESTAQGDSTGGLTGTAPTYHRSTVPLSKQGSITGVDETLDEE